MSTTFKQIFKTLFIVTISVLLVTTLVQAAWSGPTGTPPANNTPAPVNIGGVDQIKKSRITIEKADTFGIVTADENGVLNAVKKAEEGSINVNDMYVRSIGRWVSEIDSVLPPPPPPPPYITGEYVMLGGRGPNCKTHTVTIPTDKAGHISVEERVRWYDHGWYNSVIYRTTAGETTWTSGVKCIHQGGYIHYVFKY